MKNAGIRSIDEAKQRMRDGEEFFSANGSRIFFQRGRDNPYRAESYKDGVNRGLRGLWQTTDKWEVKVQYRFI